MFVALELSKAMWLVALHSLADKVSQHRFAGGDIAGTQLSTIFSEVGSYITAAIVPTA